MMVDFVQKMSVRVIPIFILEHPLAPIKWFYSYKLCIRRSTRVHRWSFFSNFFWKSSFNVLEVMKIEGRVNFHSKWLYFCLTVEIIHVSRYNFNKHLIINRSIRFHFIPSKNQRINDSANLRNFWLINSVISFAKFEMIW